MFSIHDRVSWIETPSHFGDVLLCSALDANKIKHTGQIVAEEESDHYLVKRDSDGKTQILCYRKLRKING